MFFVGNTDKNDGRSKITWYINEITIKYNINKQQASGDMIFPPQAP